MDDRARRAPGALQTGARPRGVTQEQIIAELVYLDAAVREQVGNRVELLGHLMASGELIKGQASRIEEQGMLIDRLKAEVTDLRARLGE